MGRVAPTADYVIDWSGFDDTFGLGSRYRIHRDRLMGRRLHTHRGFEELFIVDRGCATHDLNGRDYRLRRGDLVFVHTDDVHRFRRPTDDFAIINLSMPVGTIRDLYARYSDTDSTKWYDEPSRQVHLDDLHAGHLLALTRRLRSGTPTQLEIDRFLIELLATIDRRVPTRYRFPPWLAEALDRWTDDSESMGDGVSGLARLANRSREHVSRVLRRSTGLRAIDVLNEYRMEIAADRLQMTDVPIPLVAAEVGLPNLSHFYRVFKKQFGTTPRRYRTRMNDPSPVP